MKDEYICRPRTSRLGNLINYPVYRRIRFFGLSFWVHAFNASSLDIANEIINNLNEAQKSPN